jgi:predicted outer membrane repeat protein
VAGTCTACTVTCGAADHICDGAALQTALSGGGTVVACPGLYTGTISVTSIPSVTLVGAGDGADPAANTVLRDLIVSSVTAFAMSHVRVHGFARSGCEDSNGISISGSGAILTNCTIADIGPKYCDAVSAFTSSTVEMVDCLITGGYLSNYGGLQISGGQLIIRGSAIRQNYTLADGGGLHVRNDAVVKLLDGTTVTNNKADQLGGGIYATSGGTVTISSDSSVTGNTNVKDAPSNCEGDGTFNGTCGP